MLIRRCAGGDLPAMLAIINDAARAYRGVIPTDRWYEPYMPAKEIADGVVFWVAEQEGRISAVMGIQDKGDVALVRNGFALVDAGPVRLSRHGTNFVATRRMGVTCGPLDR